MSETQDRLLRLSDFSTGPLSSYTPSNNLIETVVSSEMASNTAGYIYFGKWVPKKSGAVKIRASISSVYSGSTNVNINFYILSPNSKVISASASAAGAIAAGASVLAYFDGISPGTKYTSTTMAMPADYGLRLITGLASTSYTNKEFIIEVQKGCPVYFAAGSTETNVGAKANRIEIYADEI